MSAYFDKDFLEFFTELAFNNEKSWFDVNRKRYEASVKNPFKAFVIDMIEGIAAFDDSISTDLQPKDVSFRINRDIRFAKDKTPYNTWVSAAIMKGGKKNYQAPGYYFRFGLEAFWMGGGLHNPNKENLQRIRQKIVNRGTELHSILDTPAFKKQWGSLQGDQSKRLPKEFTAAAEEEPLLFNKGYLFWREGKESQVFETDLRDQLLTAFKAAQPLNEWLRED